MVLNSVEKTEIHFIVLEKIQTIKSTLVKMAQRKTRIIMFSKLELFHKCGQSLIRFTLLLNLSFPIYCSCDIKLLEVIRRHPENVEKNHGHRKWGSFFCCCWCCWGL